MSTTQTVNLTLPLGMSLDQAETFVHDRMTSSGDDDVINVKRLAMWNFGAKNTFERFSWVTTHSTVNYSRFKKFFDWLLNLPLRYRERICFK